MPQLDRLLSAVISNKADALTLTEGDPAKLEVQGAVDSKSISGTYRFTRVWIKDGLDWKLAAEQMTRIAG